MQIPYIQANYVRPGKFHASRQILCDHANPALEEDQLLNHLINNDGVFRAAFTT